jgi:hypothetical protein
MVRSKLLDHPWPVLRSFLEEVSLVRLPEELRVHRRARVELIKKHEELAIVDLEGSRVGRREVLVYYPVGAPSTESGHEGLGRLRKRRHGLGTVEIERYVIVRRTVFRASQNRAILQMVGDHVVPVQHDTVSVGKPMVAQVFFSFLGS